MKFFAGAVLASVATAASVDLGKRDSPLDLSLELIGNTAVKAILKNNGAEALKVLKTGSILDNLEVEKSEVFAGCKLSLVLGKSMSECSLLTVYCLSFQSRL